MPGQTLSFEQAPESLCILRLSAIGDVCHAVSTVQAIQRHYPKTKITWVIGKIELSLLSGLPGVEFIVFDKRAGIKGYQDLRKALAGRCFDVLLHMQVALRASIASLCIRAKVKIGFDRSRSKEGQWLFTSKKVAEQRHPHVLEGFKAFAQAIGVQDFQPSWQMGISSQDRAWVDEKIGLDKPYAVIVPGASKAERNWTVEGYAAVADALVDKGLKVLLCGGPTSLERSLADGIIARSKNELLDLVGATTLKQLLAVLESANLLVSPDTGPAHMAVTVGTPVVGLYAHSNPRRTGPYLYQDYVVNAYDAAVQDQHGKPWDELPWGIRVRGSDLMQAISVEQVLEKIDLVLQAHSRE